MDSTPGADIADAFMQERLANAKVYCVVILTAEPKQDWPGAGQITWGQSRRNIQRQARDLLLAACHVGVKDLRNPDSGAEEGEGFTADDAGGRADILFCEVHPLREFTGDGFL